MKSTYLCRVLFTSSSPPIAAHGSDAKESSSRPALFPTSFAQPETSSLRISAVGIIDSEVAMALALPSIIALSIMAASSV
eukprot:scaffold625_cov420-Prasinococcus_capsulatus_cf.AAC.39